MTAADFESALDAYRDELMSNTRVGASGGLRALEPDRTELRRLYRAATGEVVGTATVLRNTTEDRVSPHMHHTFFNVRTSLQAGDEVMVDLVLRRDKERAHVE